MSRSTFSGPVLSGTIKYNAYKNIGNATIAQTTTIVQNSTNAVTNLLYIPANSQILDVTVDVTTAFNSATSATLSMGTAAGGTTYISGVDVKTATGRIRPTFTAAQLIAMQATAVDTAASLLASPGADNPISTLAVTITPVGATSAGTVFITVEYVQFDDRIGTVQAPTQ